MIGIRTKTLVVLAAASLTIAACGGGDEQKPSAARQDAAEPGLGAIKQYLLAHTASLEGSTRKLADEGAAYYALAQQFDGDHARMLAERRPEVQRLIGSMQRTWQQANPQYEEAEGVVAGVPELADFDVIIDAGADGSDPENAVPFDVALPDGTKLEQPGNFFFLTETSLFGTNEAFQAKGVRPDLDDDGRIAFGEAVPDAGLVMAVTRDFAKQAAELDDAAKAWTPTREDALQALVTMTPTMSEYFGQWKSSRFIAGGKADEQSFAASSRLRDIEDILGGLVTIYSNVEPSIREVDAAQAAQTGRELKRLRGFAADLRAKEDAGTKFTPEQADALGADAQNRAETIAGQVSQAAAQLGIQLDA